MRLNNFIAQVFLPRLICSSEPTVNQVYISESMLSKGVQLLFKTATFYLIFIPGLSLLFPACHESTHLHKSFSWESGRLRGGPVPPACALSTAIQQQPQQPQQQLTSASAVYSPFNCGGVSQFVTTAMMMPTYTPRVIKATGLYNMMWMISVGL